MCNNLVIVSRNLKSGSFDEDDVRSADETRFIINIEYGEGRCFKGKEEVKWAGVASRGDGTATAVRTHGGRNETIEPDFCSVM